MDMWTYVFIAALCHGLAHGEFTLPKIEFQRNCGSTLRENVGNLVFDADDLPSYLYDNKCSVTITQQDSTSSIMFYFEEYDLPSSYSYPYCKDTNLTITEGDYNGRTIVPGLAATMCGENNTLLESGLNFTTPKRELTLTYSYSDYGKRLDGRLGIKFFVYHTDTKCDGDDDYLCSDDRCVKKEYHCSDEIRVCPVDEVSCDLMTVAEGILEQITNIAKNVGWIIFIVVINYIVMTFYKNNKARIWSFINTRLGRRNSHDEEAARSSLQLETVNEPAGSPEPVQTDQNIHHSRRSSLSSRSAISLPDVTVTSTDDTTSRITQPFVPTPGAPPPSYEEVMAPSYDDVMANENKYKPSKPY